MTLTLKLCDALRAGAPEPAAGKREPYARISLYHSISSEYHARPVLPSRDALTCVSSNGIPSRALNSLYHPCSISISKAFNP